VGSSFANPTVRSQPHVNMDGVASRFQLLKPKSFPSSSFLSDNFSENDGEPGEYPYFGKFSKVSNLQDLLPEVFC
jgi:hypothetical protein